MSAPAASSRRRSEACDARCRTGIGGEAGVHPERARRRSISSRRSCWPYSQERETRAARATVSKLTGWPAACRRRSAAMARWRVSRARRRAAATRWWELSARIGHLPAVVGLAVAGFQRTDDPVQVGQDLLVHLGQPQLPVGGGGGQQPLGLVAVLAVLVQELWGGDEHRAGQAGVGMGAGLLHREPAIA